MILKLQQAIVFKTGLCKLTLTDGVYVKSHIIPVALTRLPTNGKKIVQSGIGLGVKSRFVSWYDDKLVTRAGENILEKIDTSAINILRNNQLIWSSWGSDKSSLSSDFVDEFGELTFRMIRFTQAKELQLFFLSVVWRSAVTQRPEFSEVHLSNEIVEDLRSRVVSQDSGTLSDYPVQLFQIVTKGTLHNRTPVLESKIVEFEPDDRREINYVRVYFDGLVAHVHLPLLKNFDERFLRTCLQSEADTLVFTNKFDDSRAAANIKEMVATVLKERTVPPSKLTLISSAIRNTLKN